MLLSAAEMRRGVLPGLRINVDPMVFGPADRRRRRLQHWRRFQLGDVETVTVTPALDVSSLSIPQEVIAPTASLSDIVMTLPTIEPPAAITNPQLPSPPVSTSTMTTTDWATDALKLAQIASQTYVGVVAAEHGVPGVTGGGVSAGPGIGTMTAAQLAALRGAGAVQPGSQADLFSSLFGGSGMTSMLLISGLGLLAVVMLSKGGSKR